MEDYDKLRYVVTYDKRPIMEHDELRPTMAGKRPDEHVAYHNLAILRSGFELGDLHFDITYYDEAIRHGACSHIEGDASYDRRNGRFGASNDERLFPRDRASYAG